MTKRLPDIGTSALGRSRDNKTDTTTRVAREITDREAAASAAKTERLRAARLAHEATAQPADAVKKPRKRK